MTLRAIIVAAAFMAFAFLVIGHAKAEPFDASGNQTQIIAKGAPPGCPFRYCDPRPRKWCGWWMRQHLGVKDRAGNLARWWANFGSPAHGPAIGAIVVWKHHVGIITGRTESGWVVKSGNDGRAIRERERSVKGAIAFRWPQQTVMQ